MVDQNAHAKAYSRGAYWAKRSDLMYYQYLDYMMRTVARDATSLIDVGTGNSPYLEWFYWIDRKVSVDIANPYRSETVEGIEGNLLEMELAERFDFCTCLQVLEHVPEPKAFAHRLFDIAENVIISVPLKWQKGTVPGHVNDPVTMDDLAEWTGRRPSYRINVKEPFRKRNAVRVIAVYLSEELAASKPFRYPERRAVMQD